MVYGYSGTKRAAGARQMKTYIITGGAGFIGSHVAEMLLEQHAEVFVVDDLSSGSLDNLPRHPSLHMLVRDIMSCTADEFPQTVDGIVHLAARPSVVDSWEYPLDVHQANLSATVAVVELCRKLAIPRIVFASSASIYGNNSCVPIKENSIADPESPYGLQKHASESYLRLFGRHSGFSAVSLRFFNVFGPRQQPGSPYSGVMSILLDALRKQKSITIHGDGEQTRDFIFVEDVARLVCAALQEELVEEAGGVFNVGCGQETSINQIVNIMQHYFPEWNNSICYGPCRPGDIRRSLADISKATSWLGIRPLYDIQSGIEHWLRE